MLAGGRVLTIGLSCMALVANPAAGEPRKLTCEGTLYRVKHALTIELDGKKIVGVDYMTGNPAGYTCQIEARSLESDNPDNSVKWREVGNGAAVRVGYAIDELKGQVEVARKKGFYELRIFGTAFPICGTGGSIATTIRLSPASKVCQFPDKKDPFRPLDLKGGTATPAGTPNPTEPPPT